MPKTISILGCGWLGLPLAQSLLKNGFRVSGSTTSPDKVEVLKNAGIEPFLINIENSISRIDEFLKADILIISITSKNTDAFKNLLLKIGNSPVQKVIFFSSTSVYGDSAKVVTEESPVSGSLAEIEALFKNSTSFQTTILRFGGLLGGTRHPGSFFTNKIVLEPDAPVNFIHRTDCIRIIEAVIANNVWGETFNCCADTHPTKREFYTHCAISLGLEPPQFADKSNGGFKAVSNAKLKERLQFQFSFPDVMNLPQPEDF
ncbi:MAG TPA: SDR family oxidoreductase [Patescibacteria group bacterium]|nr:SDR family oxidoreductase [Patescibacteria group bacterium]